ncbi:MAG: oligosaccharide flippase family protein [Myxococcota bacterium]|nr:oligosaccharide flippase family protein [Myxococcota bacterium]
MTRGGLWAVTAAAAGALASFGVQALLARLIAPQELGTYLLLASLAQIVVVGSQQGLPRLVVRMLGQALGEGAPGRIRTIVRKALLAAIAAGLLWVVLLLAGLGRWLARWVGDEALAGHIPLVAAWGFALSLHRLVPELFRGLHDIRTASLLQNVAVPVTHVVLLLALSFAGKDIDTEWAAIAAALAATTTVGTGYVLMRFRLRPLPAAEPVPWRTFVGESVPMWLDVVVAFVVMQAPLWMLGAMTSREAVAIYGNAVKTTGLVLVPLLVVNAVVPPLIAELHARGERRRLERMLRTSATVAALPAAGALLVLVAFGDTVLGVLFGPIYRDGHLPLAVLALGQLVSVLTGSCGFTLTMTGAQRIKLAVAVGAGATGILVGWWLVPSYGATGAAVGAAVGTAALNVGLWLAARRLVGVWTHPAIPTRAELAAVLRALAGRARHAAS